jgi:hypothetical protein
MPNTLPTRAFSGARPRRARSKPQDAPRRTPKTRQRSMRSRPDRSRQRASSLACVRSHRTAIQLSGLYRHAGPPTLVGGEPYQSGARMLVIWLGALLVLGGLVFIGAQPIWRGRLSEARRRRSSAVPRDTLEPHTLEPPTLEPRRPGAGFGLKENWPGLVCIVLGGILLLVGAFSLPSAPIAPIALPTPN